MTQLKALKMALMQMKVKPKLKKANKRQLKMIKRPRLRRSTREMIKESWLRLSKLRKRTKAKLTRRMLREKKPKRKPLRTNLRAKSKNLLEKAPQEMKLWSEKSILRSYKVINSYQLPDKN